MMEERYNLSRLRAFLMQVLGLVFYVYPATKQRVG